MHYLCIIHVLFVCYLLINSPCACNTRQGHARAGERGEGSGRHIMEVHTCVGGCRVGSAFRVEKKSGSCVCGYACVLLGGGYIYTIYILYIYINIHCIYAKTIYESVYIY